MSIETAESGSLRAAIAAHRDALDTILERYQAAKPRHFGSVARGDATSDSDIDLLVDLMPGGGKRASSGRWHRRGTERTPGHPRRRGGHIAATTRGSCECSRRFGGRVTRSYEEQFADILNAIDRCESYEQYLRSDEFESMAYDAVLRNIAMT